MVLEAKHRAANLSEDVEIWDLSGDCHQRSGKRRFAVEAGAPQACAEQDVGYGFQKRVSSFWFLVSRAQPA